MKDDLFDYLVATDGLDEFLGYEEKEKNDMGFFDKDDDELEEIVELTPKSIDELKDSGILPNIKLAKHGELIIKVINEKK